MNIKSLLFSGLFLCFNRDLLASLNVTGADGYLLVDENVSQSLQDEVKE